MTRTGARYHSTIPAGDRGWPEGCSAEWLSLLPWCCRRWLLRVTARTVKDDSSCVIHTGDRTLINCEVSVQCMQSGLSSTPGLPRWEDGSSVRVQYLRWSSCVGHPSSIDRDVIPQNTSTLQQKSKHVFKFQNFAKTSLVRICVTNFPCRRKWNVNKFPCKDL